MTRLGADELLRAVLCVGAKLPNLVDGEMRLPPFLLPEGSELRV